MNLNYLLEKLKSGFPEFNWTVPPNLSMGILTTNQAFLEAKKQARDPKEIANVIKMEVEKFAVENDLPLVVKTAGPYLNLDLQPQLWLNFLKESNLDLNNILDKSNQKVILEYISTNAAKPMHAGHIRNANLGEALRRILKLKYDNLITQNYWGDWGVQFGILIWGWKEFEQNKQLQVKINEVLETVNFEDFNSNPVDVLVKVYVWANQQKESVAGWDELVRQEFLKLEQGDETNRVLWTKFLDYSKKELSQNLQMLNVAKFDFEEGESNYEQDLKKLYEVMETNNLWQKEGLARFIDLENLIEKWTDIPKELAKNIKNFGRCYLVSSGGYTTYPFRDVAARWAWARDHKSEIMITVTGNEQKHNFDQAFSIVSYLASTEDFQKINNFETIEKLNWYNLKHVSYGFLTLPEGKMSTRKGNFLVAKDVIEKVVVHSKTVLQNKNPEISQQELEKTSKIVAIAALKWYDLARDSTSDIVLDMNKILSFEGNTGVYQLYTLARINSILEKNQDLKLNDLNQVNIKKLNIEEILILKEMYILPYILDNICYAYKPHQLCNHLFELASKVNSWYVKYSVSSESDVERKQSLFQLCNKIKNHMWTSLELLGIEAVNKL